MKRMILYAAIAFSGLTVCGLLVLRHACRTAPLLPATSDLPAPPRRNVAPVDRWQGEIKVDTRIDYPSEPMRRLLKKLRQEEIRQRPQEGRN
ncbi:MAG: hypothetical protein HOP00_02745 [Nitrospira sp.]|nr:hypothetical protein [Nitrospira sp.]